MAKKSKTLQLALQLQKEGGKKTVSKTVYKKNIADCMKQAAKIRERRTA